MDKILTDREMGRGDKLEREPDGYIANRLMYYCKSPLQIFTELDELDLTSGEWVEKARWIKYEQTVEEEADRWGKPQVSSLAFHSVVELTKCLEFGEY